MGGGKRLLGEKPVGQGTADGTQVLFLGLLQSLNLEERTGIQRLPITFYLSLFPDLEQ